MTQKKYGVHNFFFDVDHGYYGSFYRCQCGAMEFSSSHGMGCGEMGFSPAKDPLPDPKQCRLNPLT